MTHYKKLVGKKCYLSPCSLEDAEKWTEWDNDLEVVIPLGPEAHTTIPLDRVKQGISKFIERQDHIFSIIDLKTDNMIGRCLLFDIDQINRKATFGIDIGEKDYWDKGYGQDATKLMLDYGFNLLNLNNIMLGVYSYNERAINCYKKVGFKEIGRRRKSKFVGGKWFDGVFMDILAKEFESVYVNRFVEGKAKRSKK
jgi:RimJ/RimL family protein N-acetyltransferase